MKKVTTVLSDLGNVVVTFDNTRTIRSLSVYAPLRSPRTFEMMRQDISSILFGSDGLWNLFDRGRVHSSDILHTLMSSIGYHPYELQLKESHARQAWKDVFAFNQPVVDLWKRLRAAGLTFTAVSNIDALRWEQVDSMGVGKLFDNLVLSFEERCLKQDGPEIFEKALGLSGCEPEEAVFIDDREDCLHHAARLGINTIQYDCRTDDFKALEKPLMLLGLPVLKEA